MICRITLTLLALFTFPALSLKVSAQPIEEKVCPDSCDYYSIPLSDLTLQPETVLPERSEENPQRSRRMFSRSGLVSRSMIIPRVVLDGPGEAYVYDGRGRAPATGAIPWGQCRLLARVPTGQRLRGFLVLPQKGSTESARIRFTAKRTHSSEDARKTFQDVQLVDVRMALFEGLPGTPWYRYRLSQIDTAHTRQRPTRVGTRSQPDLETTMHLFSGGRAVSENISATLSEQSLSAGAWTESIDTLEPAELRPVDFSDLMDDSEPASDPLAQVLPADQYALFFPGPAAFQALLEETRAQGTSLVRMFDEQSYAPGVQARYERQLLVSLTEVVDFSRRMPVDQLAITGGGIDLVTGTDIALVIATPDADQWAEEFRMRQQSASQANEGVNFRGGTYGGTDFSLVSNHTRSISAVVATLPGVVILSNSPKQVERILDTANGALPALDATIDYTFFRQRYATGDPDEDMFLIITDQTFRRWVSPRDRIAQSRRLRARAVLADEQIRHLLNPEQKTSGTLSLDTGTTSSLGQLSHTGEGPLLPGYGTLAFMKPAIEMQVNRISPEERDAYNRFKRFYETGFRGFCDPIGVRFKVGEEQTEIEMTIHPLRFRSDYLRYARLSQDTGLQPLAGAPGSDGAFEASLAISQEAPALVSLRRALTRMAPEHTPDLFQWLGDWVSVSLETDPQWEAMRANVLSTAPGTTDQTAPVALSTLPVALTFASENPVGLSAFILGLKHLLNAFSPNIFTFEPRTHNDQGYVRLGVPPMFQTLTSSTLGESLSECFYYTSLDRLVFTLREDVMQRAIDRHVQVITRAGIVDAEKTPPVSTAWEGGSLGFRLTPDGLTALEVVRGDYAWDRLRAASWRNIPMLNAWRKYFDAEDAIAFHETHWFAHLTCPGGGTYQWDDTWQTYTSTVFGHPGKPKPYAALTLPWQTFKNAEGSLTFEGSGIRTHLILNH